MDGREVGTHGRGSGQRESILFGRLGRWAAIIVCFFFFLMFWKEKATFCEKFPLGRSVS